MKEIHILLELLEVFLSLAFFEFQMDHLSGFLPLRTEEKITALIQLSCCGTFTNSVNPFFNFISLVPSLDG